MHFCAIHSPKSVRSFTHVHKTPIQYKCFCNMISCKFCAGDNTMSVLFREIHAPTPSTAYMITVTGKLFFLPGTRALWTLPTPLLCDCWRPWVFGLWSLEASVLWPPNLLLCIVMLLQFYWFYAGYVTFSLCNCVAFMIRWWCRSTIRCVIENTVVSLQPRCTVAISKGV